MSQLDKPGTLGFFQHTSLNTLSRPLKTAAWCLLNRKETRRALGLSTLTATLRLDQITGQARKRMEALLSAPIWGPKL